uniref:Variant erythrocyte surface antigen-beta subunit n=1 Tax=Babesia bovis TaxID=5865 RepID=S6B676_BABBO|nr:variant erythrocyte surface antigen- beta subunit [Babesia bovis]
MQSNSDVYSVVGSLTRWSGDCTRGSCKDTLKCLYGDAQNAGQCSQYLCPLSGKQYGQLSPAMAGTYLSWLVYLIGEFRTGLEGLETAFKGISCASDGCRSVGVAGNGCGNGTCTRGTHGNTCDGSSGGVCGCTSVVSCTGVLPVLYRYGFGYGNVEALHDTAGVGTPKKCDAFLTTLKGVLKGEHIKHNGSGLHHEINKLIYTTRLPWIFVLTLAWLVAVLYLAFGAIWPLDWTHMRSHCTGWFRKGSLSPWEVLMVGKNKGRGILEFFGKEGKGVVGSTTSGYRWVKWLMVIIGTVAVFGGPLVAALVQNNDAWKIPLAVLLGIGGGALLVAVMVKAVWELNSTNVP